VTLLGTPIAIDQLTSGLAREFHHRPYRILTYDRAARAGVSTEPVTQAVSGRFTRICLYRRVRGSGRDLRHRGKSKGIQVHTAVAGISMNQNDMAILVNSLRLPLLSRRICPPAYGRVVLRQVRTFGWDVLDDPEREI
jgi:hypothetical protein